MAAVLSPIVAITFVTAASQISSGGEIANNTDRLNHVRFQAASPAAGLQRTLEGQSLAEVSLVSIQYET